MTFADILTGTSEGYALIKRAVVADLGSLADHNAASVVYEQSLADGRTGMDLDSCEESCSLAYKSRGKMLIFLYSSWERR